MGFDDLCRTAYDTIVARQLSDTYVERLDFELAEIRKQGAEAYWTTLYQEKKRFHKNPNHLLFPWLLGVLVDGANIDPILARSGLTLNTVRASAIAEFKKKNGYIPADLVKDPDMPDIDLDCLPMARDPIKAYAMEKYGDKTDSVYSSVCSVGTWQTYKFRSAIIDVCTATARADKAEIYALTTSLPDDVDELKEGGISQCKGKTRDNQTGEEKECKAKHALTKCPVCGSADTDSPTIGKLLEEHAQLRDFQVKYPEVIDYAVQLIGRVRNMGMHAGALIIADRNLFGNIPMARSGRNNYWVSMWSEGRNTQLSKFGYVKWDILGLKTLEYISNCCRLIEMNRGIRFCEPDSKHPLSGWEDIDPAQNKAGFFYDCYGQKHVIELNDEHALDLANRQKTDAVFQFDTDLAKSILANGVRHFDDLLFFNAAGHPGPMAAIPEAMDNRNDPKQKWKDALVAIHPELYDILKDTYGIILWQEQLAAIWQRLGGFTAPEAQDARKAVAKKWTHKLKPIGQKWIDGATKTIGKKHAEDLWSKMVSFGRYAFNKSHGVSYCLVAHRCLWLKAHFAPEWWAAVMSDCHAEKLVRYMSVARAEGWRPTDITKLGRCQTDTDAVTFGTINIHNLTSKFTVTDNVINQGMIGIKGIGGEMAKRFEGRGEYGSIDDFVEQKGKQKQVMERFIKLGAFSHLPGHNNSRAVWNYYLYKHCGGRGMTEFKADIRKKLLAADGWNDTTIKAERDRMLLEYRRLYPNRRKIPPKINNWMPEPDDSLIKMLAISQEDFSLADMLGFEKAYLGYYLHSPLDLFDIQGNCTIRNAKIAAAMGAEIKLEVIITKFDMAVTRNGKDYIRLIVDDGVQTALVFIWTNDAANQQLEILQPGVGVQMYVEYDKARGTFALAHGELIIKLMAKGWNQKPTHAAQDT